MYHRLTPITGIFLSAVVGIVVDRLACPGPLVYLISGLMVGVVFLLCTLHRGDELRSADSTRRSDWRSLGICLTLWVLVGSSFAFWHYLDWWYEPSDAFRRGLSEPTPVTAIVEVTRVANVEPAEPWHPLRRGAGGERVKMEVSIRALHQFTEAGFQWIQVSGHGTLHCSISAGQQMVVPWSTLQAGTRLRVLATAIPLRHAANPGGWDSATHRWGRRQSFILSVGNTPEAVQITGKSNRWITQLRDRIRNVMRNHLRTSLRVKQFRLAAAVLLGDRFQLNQQELELFAEGGVIHVMAISGLHVGILALGLLFPARFFPRAQRWLAIGALAVIWFYAVVVDLRPPVTRAAILITVSVVGRSIYRENHAVYSLYLAGLIILTIDPSALFSVGTQLSFVAVATLIMSKQVWQVDRSRIQRLLIRRKTLPTRLLFHLCGSFKATACATLMVVIVAFPLTSANFHLVSLVGFLLNTLLAIPVAVGILSGFFVSLLGSVPMLESVPAVIAEFSFASIWQLSEWAHWGSSGVFWLSGPTDLWCVLFYVLLAAAVGIIPTRFPTQATLGWCLGVWVLGSLFFWPHRMGMKTEVDEFRLVFINVEHGTSVLLEISNGGVWLYDAGSLKDFRMVGREIADVLWSRGHSRIDGILVSHADLDHFNAVPFLLPRFAPKQILVSDRTYKQLFVPGDKEKKGAAVSYLAQQLDATDAQLQTISAGDQFQLGTADLKVLGPNARHIYSSDNDASLVLMLSYRRNLVLLPGDIEAEGIGILQQQVQREHCDVLMVPHHGSVHSEPELFSQWSLPRYAVISTGHKELSRRVLNSYRRVAGRREGNVLMTSREGLIEFRVEQTGLEPFTK